MAENVVHCDDEFVHSIKTLLWGNTIKKDVFKRWAQGKLVFLCIFFIVKDLVIKDYMDYIYIYIYIKITIIIMVKK